MKIQTALFIVLLSCIACDNWAVLVAGSNTYSNYRHQSDIFHMYHILTSRGVNPDNIIVFAYDDIANAKRNPFPGQVFNQPDGKDVYAGVVIDYFGKDVTPENFIAAITGDASAVSKTDERTTGKVLTSTTADNVFMYFSDHGSSNLIAFPSKYLYADELNDAFKVMHEKGLYKELVFYLEACHAGSMFDPELPENISIYTTTAANPSESSYGEYCSSEAKVNGTLIGSCLGDEYSVRFMEDIDSRPGAELKGYTLQEQYEYLVNNENYRLEWYRMQAEQSNDLEAENEYYEEILAQGRVTKIFEIFNKRFELGKIDYSAKVDYDCYRQVSQSYADRCGTLIDRDFKFMPNIANFCTKGIKPIKADRAFKAICQ